MKETMEVIEKEQLTDQLLELLDADDDEMLLRSFLQDKDIPDLLYQYPELGLRIKTENKLKTIAALIHYKERDEPWK